MKKVIMYFCSFLAMLMLPTTIRADVDPNDLGPEKHLFKLVTCKEDITNGARYLIAGQTTHDGLFLMCPSSDLQYNRHYAVSATWNTDDKNYITVDDETFARDRYSYSKPMLLRGYGNADDMQLKFEYDHQYSLYGYSRYYGARINDAASHQLPVDMACASTYNWQFSFDASTDWGTQTNFNGETKGMYMRMPIDRYGSYSQIDYNYITAGGRTLTEGESMGVYFTGTDYPQTDTRVLLFKEICRHLQLEVREVDAVAPTCLAGGYTKVYYCAGCEKYFDDEECTQPSSLGAHYVQALGHDWSGDECSRCHAKSEVREFSNWSSNQDGFVLTQKFEDKYYAIGINPVEEGLEAVEIEMGDDNYFSADINKVALINENGGNYYICGDPSARLRIYQSKLQTKYYDVATDDFYDKVYNRISFDGYAAEGEDGIWDNIPMLYGNNDIDGKNYDVVLKQTTDGKPYFGIHSFNDQDAIHHDHGMQQWFLQCPHEILLHTPGSDATCLEPSVIESYFCEDCYNYYADAKCHQHLDIDGLQPVMPMGHHYESGSNVCTHCGEAAGIYRPVTKNDLFNAGYNYVMVGHIGGQYYTLKRPTLKAFRPDWDEDTPEEYLEKKYMWDGDKIQAVPVTLNEDGSFTANYNEIIEFTLNNIVNGRYDPDDYHNKCYIMRSPWGFINDGEWEPTTATFDYYIIENWKHVTDAPETVWRQFELADPSEQYFEWTDNGGDYAMPDNILNATVEQNSVLMHRTWAADASDRGTYVLVKENDEVYFTPLNKFCNPYEDYEHPNAEIMVPHIFYCASKPMPHLDINSAQTTIYGDELSDESLQTALEEVTEEGDMVGNIDLTQVARINMTADQLGLIIVENENVSNNALAILPSEAEVTGTNIIVDGICENIAITDGAPFIVPEQYADDENLIQTASVSYERAMSSSSTWGTLYMPFALKSDDNVQLFKLAEVTIDGEEGVLTFEPVDEVAESTPCVFRRKTSNTSVTFENNNVAIHPAGASVSTDVNDWNMQGTFEGCKIMSNWDQQWNYDGIMRYYIASNQFWQSEEQTTVPPFRAWFEQGSADHDNGDIVCAKSLRIFAVENDETSILEIDANGNLIQLPTDAIYDINGNRVNKAEHGVFIINGKKVLVK